VDATAIGTVSIAVVGLTQLVKWGGVPDRYGPLAVLVLSILGTSIWAWSRGNFERATAFDYFAGGIIVAMSAAGIFGFTRAGSDAITKTSSPPSGAGSSPTTP
jgi:hypothetical protein